MTRFFSGSVTIIHCQPCELLPVGAWTATSRHCSKISRETGLSKSRRFRTARVVVRMWCASISSIVGRMRRDELVACLGRKVRQGLVHVVLCRADHGQLVVRARGDLGGGPTLGGGGRNDGDGGGKL